jgi:hypothetical protein
MATRRQSGVCAGVAERGRVEKRTVITMIHASARSHKHLSGDAVPDQSKNNTVT